MKRPTFCFEKKYIDQGFTVIAGADEVGAGSLAGPVVAAAVVLPLDSRLGDINDSKLLSEKRREDLFDQILLKASAYGVGEASHKEVDLINVRQASLLAMRRALEHIEGLEVALIDAWKIPELDCKQESIIRGDQLVKSIAAASIIAKVTRDRMMLKIAQEYPEYEFNRHKGYGTALHRSQIEKHGPCPIHRMSYKIFEKYR
ncbi:ribonuclease HII [Candidatus Uhrbacteria bacterium]|jgi:ribonuclease HII|nr:ribonuclease HII [Candidatus Uhrbacteria bacterium]MBT7717630.1 ribonuclease HII [Candidatus Uhrbacteria bacterium]